MDSYFSDFQIAHAASFVHISDKILMCWHGRKKGQNHQTLWTSFNNDDCWSEPAEIESLQHLNNNFWNPVLFQAEDGHIWLFYKTGENVQQWKGWMLISSDGGETWSTPFALKSGYLGPTRNPPLALENGWILSPSSREDFLQWYPCFEKINVISGESRKISLMDDKNTRLKAIQPALVRRPDNSILGLCRSNLKKIYQTESFDQGATWSPLTVTDIANPNSAISTLTVDDGYYLAMNPSFINRAHLWVLFFPWKGKPKRVLEIYENGRMIAYPSIIELDSQHLLISYSINQKIIAVKEVYLGMHQSVALN